MSRILANQKHLMPLSFHGIGLKFKFFISNIVLFGVKND